jgi:uncharacterized membrane-anchored protein YitT (DUF2179 family)
MIKEVSKLIDDHKLFSKKWFIDILYILVGSFIVAAAYVFFISPFKIIPGGVYGISIMLHFITKDLFSFLPAGLPIGITALFFNIPLAYASYKLLGKSAIVKTVITFMATSFFVDTLSLIYGYEPIVAGDKLLSSIYGGAVLGIGVALIFKAHATSAGTDVISKILAKKLHMQLGYVIIIVDSVIVLMGLIAFGDISVPLYSWITILVYGKVVDVVMHGISNDKAVLIISDKNTQISERIIFDLRRGGTFLHGKGMYNGIEKDVICSVVNYRELDALTEYVQSIDDNAFMIVLNATEIVGKGFKTFDEAQGK